MHITSYFYKTLINTLNPIYMTTTSTPPLISRLIKNLRWVEGILLVLLVIGIILMNLNDDRTLLTVSLIGLAVVFFLYAHRPIDMPVETNEKAGFSELLAYGILPKVMWIGCAIATTGILFYTLERSGYKEMLMIGGLSTGIVLLLFTIFLLTGVKNLRFLFPNLVRSVPLFAIVVYILMQ